MTDRVTLLGFTVSDEALAEILRLDRQMPVQTHTFAWAVVRALAENGCTVTLLSAAPVSSYPGHRRIRFPGGAFRTRGTAGEALSFVNLVGLKHLTRFVSACRVGLPAIRRWRSQVLMIHGVHSPFLWFGVLAGRRRGLTVVPILTDPPGGAGASDGAFTRLLRRVDVSLIRRALRRCDGVVAVTQALADDFATGRPALVLEGVFTPPDPAAPDPGLALPRPRTPTGTFDIGYAGGLTHEYGVDRLVEAVRDLDDPLVRLRLYGRGPLSGWLAQQSIVDFRIELAGLLGREELARRLREADVLVNPRPAEQSFVRYSFPSKLIEYMSTGVPVITTPLSGIPTDYWPHLVLAGPGADGLRQAIEQVRAMSPAEATSLGTGAATFIRTSRGPEAQGARLRGFLAGLRDEPAAPRRADVNG
jgi:glycosyltransferase involved in cell wall biosynthesis